MALGIAAQPADMKLVNFGDFYYPSPALKGGLEELVIFAENATKREIPNGSVFVYNSANYNPDILKSDVGCGITAFATGALDFDAHGRSAILRAVDKLGAHIGQGNHFLDFTTPHPVMRRTGVSGNMIFLHSDFNNANVVPTSYEQAKDFEKYAQEKRVEYIEELARLLGVCATFYADWTHNSVSKEDGNMVYRKGAIDLRQNNGVGALALNPIDGIMLYAAEFEDYRNSMQHGLGRIGSRSEVHKLMDKQSQGIARGYSISQVTDDVKATVKRTYNSIDKYLTHFGMDQELIGFCVPEFFVTTKL